MRKGTITVQTQSQHQHQHQHHHHLHHHPLSIGPPNGSQEEEEKEEEEPPAKKRKLFTTTTKDTHPKPPATITITRDKPPGPLLQTTNGVKSALDVNEDEILPPPAERMPKRATRSPAPVPTTTTTTTTKPPPPQEKTKTEDKRTLRSQDDGPRLKSELAVYFPNYEDVMFDVPAEEEDFLTVDSTLYIAEDTAKKKDGTPNPVKSGTASANGRKPSFHGLRPPATPNRTTSIISMASPSVSLDFLAKTSSETPEDPLTDPHFLKSHNRAERKEKQLRNIERERAMHEKVQLERLLDGLQGHDWLRVLGVTGITDGEAKKYEPKRNYFILEVQALIGKFAQWKEQEKKLRLRKEAAQARQDEVGSNASSIDRPSSDFNASASRQLQQETVNAVKASASKSKGKMSLYGPSAASHPSTPLSSFGPARGFLQPIPHSPEAPITSFYAKRHLRDAALSKSRSTTRNVTAFGHPVLDLDEQEFSLPEDFVTPDALRANARERRRRKRESTAAK